MTYSLGEAAKAAGKAKSTVLRAIKTGRISASKGDNGAYRIDPSELHRAFDAPVSQTTQSNNTEPQNETVEHLKKTVERVENERERERDQMQATIDDLRARLDRSEDRITAMLVDKRKPEPLRRWWQRRTRQ